MDETVQQQLASMNDCMARRSWGRGYYWYIFEGNVEKFAEELYMMEHTICIYSPTIHVHS